MVELDPRLWPDVASTAPATIMVYGKPLTLPPRGTPMKLPGPWTGGRKSMAQRKEETAEKFAERCQEAIDAELVRAVPPIRVLSSTHTVCGASRRDRAQPRAWPTATRATRRRWAGAHRACQAWPASCHPEALRRWRHRRGAREAKAVEALSPDCMQRPGRQASLAAPRLPGQPG